MSKSTQVFHNPSYNPSKTFPPPNPQIRTFHRSLPHYSPTPLVSLPTIASSLGIQHLLLKDESTRLGLTAFKILGASWATVKAVSKRLGLTVESLSAEDDNGTGFSLKKLAAAAKEAGLVLYAATDGNHGRAVARMASYLDVEAVIFVPAMLDDEAVGKIRDEGAKIKVWDGDYDSTVLATKEAAEKCEGRRGVLISDTALVFGDETASWIVDGYQTLFDELEEQMFDIIGEKGVTHVLTPVGVGSLAQAVVTHFGRGNRRGRMSTPTSVITVEPETAACLKASLEAGKMATVAAEYTICSGMCCGTLSANGWPVLKEGVEVAMSVRDKDVHDAVRELEPFGVEAGPCGAATLAGLRQIAAMGVDLGPESVVVILCTEGARGYQLR